MPNLLFMFALLAAILFGCWLIRRHFKSNDEDHESLSEHSWHISIPDLGLDEHFSIWLLDAAEIYAGLVTDEELQNEGAAYAAYLAGTTDLIKPDHTIFVRTSYGHEFKFYATIEDGELVGVQSEKPGLLIPE